MRTLIGIAAVIYIADTVGGGMSRLAIIVLLILQLICFIQDLKELTSNQK